MNGIPAQDPNKLYLFSKTQTIFVHDCDIRETLVTVCAVIDVCIYMKYLVDNIVFRFGID